MPPDSRRGGSTGKAFGRLPPAVDGTPRGFFGIGFREFLVSYGVGMAGRDFTGFGGIAGTHPTGVTYDVAEAFVWAAPPRAAESGTQL